MKLFLSAVATFVFAFNVQSAAPYSATISTNNAVPAVIAAAPDCNTVANNPFTNCGFETGDFTGWVTQDLTSPFFAINVQPAGITAFGGFFATAPTEGSFVAAHGFDGNGPGFITLAQDVALPANAANLVFDYRAAWDLQTFAPPNSLDRHLYVEIQPAGGGAPLRTTSALLTMPYNTIVADMGNQTASVYIGDFAGQNVRIALSAEVPEAFTGPAFIQFDNFSVASMQVIPATSHTALWLLVLLLMGATLLFYRARFITR